jgi:hypothetical protein
MNHRRSDRIEAIPTSGGKSRPLTAAMLRFVGIDGCRTVALLAVLGMTGCFSGVKEYEGGKGRRTMFLPSVRSYAAEPVYARTRWVHPPEVLPARSVPGEDFSRGAAPIRPVYQMTFKDASLKEASRILAATARYTSYCAPSIEDQKVSVNNLGNIDELAAIIAKNASITVVVDHPNKAVRFLSPSESADPQLFDEATNE